MVRQASDEEEVKRLPSTLSGLAIAVATALLLWMTLAGLAWNFNNPRGDWVTFWTHFDDAMRFQRVPGLQEK